MLRLVCRENFLEYAGDGFIQCGRHVICPKKKNNKILGFDCLLYIDNLPVDFVLTAVEIEDSTGNIGNTGNDSTKVDDTHIKVDEPITADSNKPVIIEEDKPILTDSNKPVNVDDKKPVTIDSRKIVPLEDVIG